MSSIPDTKDSTPTAGPWWVNGSAIETVEVPSSVIGHVYDESDDCGVTNTQARANAEFIVRAVNCHEELLEALEALRGEVPDTPTGITIAKVDAAIKKARGA